MNNEEKHERVFMGDNNICPVTGKLCDDETCTPGAECNIYSQISQITEDLREDEYSKQSKAEIAKDHISELKTKILSPQQPADTNLNLKEMAEAKYPMQLREGLTVFDLRSAFLAGASAVVGREGDGWVAVSDRLPEWEGTYLAWVEKHPFLGSEGGVFTAYYGFGNDEDAKEMFWSFRMALIDVTHWRYLPEAPTNQIKGKETK